jgi:hypothetical protein
MEPKTSFSEALDELVLLKNRVEELERKIKCIQKEQDSPFETEYPKLVKKARTTQRFLSVLILLSVAIVLSQLLSSRGILNTLLIVIFCGIAGSSISALTSSLERQANGWEFRNGLKYPENEPKDKFSERINPFFWYRPILGIVAAMLIYSMVEAGIIESGKNTIYHKVFYSILAGLFAKTLWEKLREVFGSIVKVK